MLHTHTWAHDPDQDVTYCREEGCDAVQCERCEQPGGAVRSRDHVHPGGYTLCEAHARQLLGIYPVEEAEVDAEIYLSEP